MHGTEVTYPPHNLEISRSNESGGITLFYYIVSANTVGKMRPLILLFFSITLLASAQAQKSAPAPEILSPKQVTAIFTDSLKKGLGLSFPIFRVYKYSDKTGQYYFVFTESRDSISDEKDTINYKIKGVNLKIEKSGIHQIWELNDFTDKSKEETSIWFWTRYADFKDYDNDSLADPIIIYGTGGLNGYDDGRIKILIYYKGQKIAIRHQNGELDNQRSTQVDKAFYSLPEILQSAIRQKMEAMIQNNRAIFPYGWQQAMKNKKTMINELHK